MLDRRHFAIAVGSLALASGTSVFSQSYPAKPIRIIVPFPSGDLSDVIARLVALKLPELLGQPFVIENRPGASGQLGLQLALQAEADGYTFVMGQMGSMAVAPILNKQPFDVRGSFVPVALMYSNYLLLAAHPDFPPKTIPELIAYSKANPGKVRLGTNGEGGFPHLAAELLKSRSGFEFSHIPYKGNAQSITDVIGGQLEMTIAGYSSLYSHVQTGRLKGIGVTGARRPANAPDIAAIGESVDGYEALGWFGLFARKGTPAPVIDKVNAAVNTVLEMPDVVERAKVLGLDLASRTPQAFETVWARDYAKWGQIIRGLKLDGSK